MEMTLRDVKTLPGNIDWMVQAIGAGMGGGLVGVNHAVAHSSCQVLHYLAWREKSQMKVTQNYWAKSTGKYGKVQN